MHGLINTSIQSFVMQVYGNAAWSEICLRADLGFDRFETMLTYDDGLTEAVIEAAVDVLGKDRGAILEDMGHHLVTNPASEPLRRLLRFGGENFADFLHSLDELHDRVRLALPDLELPRFDVREHAPGSFSLHFDWSASGLGQAVLGAIRAMADDYGTLAVLDYAPRGVHGESETITVSLLESHHAAGRDFALARAEP
jgi:hypothetical protein